MKKKFLLENKNKTMEKITNLNFLPVENNLKKNNKNRNSD